MTLAEVFAETARRHGAGTAFGLLGEANLALVMAARRAGIDWVALRREDAVVAAADGHAQGTGRPALALVSQGPALANAVNPLIGARKGRTPLVLVTGALADDQRDAPQWCDQAALAAACGVRFVPARSAADVDAAFAHARDERLPVVLQIATAAQLDAPATAARLAPPAPAPVAVPDPADLDRAADLLAAARQPVVLAGRGAVAARAEIVALAARSGAWLATTLLAKGLFAGEPNDIGVTGGFSTAGNERIVAGADLVLVLGAGLNAYTTRGGRLLGATTVVRVDRDPAALASGPAAAVDLCGDAAAVARALTGRLPAVRPPVGPAAADEPEPDESDDSGLDLRAVSRLLDAALPADRALVTDLGYFTSEPAITVAVRHPRRHAFPLHFGSIGLGLATAIGLAAADPSVPTLCAVGDGGLCAALGELESLARTGLPVVVAVYDDSAYGVEVHELRHRGLATDLAEFAPVDFAALATALGIPAVAARRAGDLDAVRAALTAPSGPLLVHFQLNPTVVTRWYRENVHAAPVEERS